MSIYVLFAAATLAVVMLLARFLAWRYRARQDRRPGYLPIRDWTTKR